MTQKSSTIASLPINAASLLVTLCALTGCTTLESFTDQHPTATKVIAGSAVLTLYTLTRGHRSEPDKTFGISDPLTCSDPAVCR